MTVTFREVFDQIGSDLVVDNFLCKRIARYKNGFIEKNEEHINFFGGNLLGVEQVRHTAADRLVFFEDVMGMDEHDVRQGILKTSVVTADFARLSDPYNSTALYLLYRLKNGTKLNDKAKHQAMLDVVFMLQVKLFTSLLSHWFKHRAQLDEAKATYASLSKRFGLKEAGSWNKWFVQRAEDFISPEGIHQGVIKTFAPDEMVAYAITEPQDRLRATMKKFYKVFQEVRKNGDRIKSASATLEIDGELLIKSQVSNTRRYLEYIKGVIPDKNTFIRDECFQVATQVVHTVNGPLLNKLLVFCSDNYHRGKAVPMEPLVDELILHAIEYIATNRVALKRTDDFSILVTNLESLYGASRMQNQGLILAKNCADKIVDTARLSKNNAMQSSLRRALQVYIVVRTLTMGYYK